MKKTTLAVAALLTTLATATIATAVYAEDASTTTPATADTCKDGKDINTGKDCVATDSTAAPAADGAAAPATESTGSDS